MSYQPPKVEENPFENYDKNEDQKGIWLEDIRSEDTESED